MEKEIRGNPVDQRCAYGMRFPGDTAPLLHPEVDAGGATPSARQRDRDNKINPRGGVWTIEMNAPGTARTARGERDRQTGSLRRIAWIGVETGGWSKADDETSILTGELQAGFRS